VIEGQGDRFVGMREWGGKGGCLYTEAGEAATRFKLDRTVPEFETTNRGPECTLEAETC
jgi:hypothetical protein